MVTLATAAVLGVAAVGAGLHMQGGEPGLARRVADPVAAGNAPARPARAPIDGNIAYLSNPSVRLGIDLGRGGAIVYLADRRDGRNLINNHDLGRQIQQSYYSGPHPYGKPAGVWTNAGWNPVASGDAFDHRAVATVTRLGPNSLHTRVVPYQWALQKVRCECVFESWITLDGNQVRVRNRLTNRRSDRRQYAAEPQELPAVYFNGFLRNFVSYTGARPFTDAPVTKIAPVWPPRPISATEYWTAALGREGRGVGVINSATMWVDVGFAGPVADGDTYGDSTAYIAPRSRDIIDHDIVYDSGYRLVIGSLAQIRAAARTLRPALPAPSYRFRTDRQGWHYANAVDTGWPIAGRLRVRADAPDPQLISPERAFPASAVPALWITAAFRDTGTTAQLFWSTSERTAFSEAQSLKFRIIPDGRMRTYALPLAAQPGWKGLIRTLRLDPPGRDIDLCAIAARPTGC